MAIIAHKGQFKINGKRDGSVWSIPKVFPQAMMHPTEKPNDLMTRLIDKFSYPISTILDPFMGSGTTLRAAKDLGRKCIGIELEERYCEIAAKRLQQEVFNFGTDAP